MQFLLLKNHCTSEAGGSAESADSHFTRYFWEHGWAYRAGEVGALEYRQQLQ